MAQRQESERRAAKMHAARVMVVAAPAAIKARADSPRQTFMIGCSGWFYWHWRGRFYPEGMPTAEWFPHYAKRFRTVELNAPFYSWPTLATVRGWLRAIGRRQFVYTVKVSELITHVRRFSATKTLIRDFGYIADILGPRMGCFLYQLPPSFRYTPARLARIVTQLEPGRRNVVEFRHADWWNERVFAAFRDAGLIFCCCSAPRLPDTLVKTAPEIYLRFHGTRQWYRHNYSADELMGWAKRIRESGAERVWAYFNNDREGYAVKNARLLQRLLASPREKKRMSVGPASGPVDHRAPGQEI